MFGLGSTSWWDNGTGVDPTQPLTLLLALTLTLTLTPTRSQNRPNQARNEAAPL